MKRLRDKLLSLDEKDGCYNPVYEGAADVIPGDGSPPYSDADRRYFYGDIGYEFERNHRRAPDVPNITVSIPARTLFGQGKSPEKMEGEQHLKRLKYYFGKMEDGTETYKYREGVRQRDIYDGDAHVGNALPEPENVSDPVFWSGENSYALERTNRLSPDMPTVTVRMPAEGLGADRFSAAAADCCLRAFVPYIEELNAELYNKNRPDAENGRYYVHVPGGEVLPRNGAYFALCPQKDYDNGPGNTVYLKNDGIPRPPRMCLCIKLQVQLPRKKLRKAVRMLCRDLPDAVERFAAGFDVRTLERALCLAAKQERIRAWLAESEFCAFIAEGSILPREKGTQKPMLGAVPFAAPPGDETEVCGVRGMGIRRGVTVITGGGYSGKSTLLDAIAAGVYDHAEGDGRELCLADRTAVSISAEDGRSVKACNISPFIKWIPGGDPESFSTDRASGSTSQASNIIEAVDSGAGLLLIDEDRSATNFMIRDGMMKTLIENEPITPFTQRARELYAVLGVSVILVIGGSGEYLSVADRVYLMDDFVIGDATARAKQICANAPEDAAFAPARWGNGRTLLASGFAPYPEGSGSERLEISDMGFILIGDEKIDIRQLHNLATVEQRNALGFMLRALEAGCAWESADIGEEADRLYEKIEREGIDCVFSNFFAGCGRFLELPRRQELLALVNRMRRVKFLRRSGPKP